MADRRVKVDLVADVSRYKSGMMEAAASTKVLGDVVDDEMSKMDKSGEHGGGLLAQGVRTGIMRNSPLIVAGVSAGLALGAPAMLAGAAVLFAGLGAAAAAQTAEVREAWVDLGADIKAGAASDAAVLVPVFAGAADTIGAAYQRLRPEIRDTFVASAPLVESFTDSLTKAAELAMPGLVRAVEAGGPVIDGLGSLVEKVGQGVSDFFDALAKNPAAAGAALDSLGDILGNVLPLLGELLGTGTQLASVVLPPVASILGAVADVAERLGSVLPLVAAGFAGFKIAGALSNGIGSFADKLGGTETKAGRAATAVSSMGKTLPVLGGLLAVASADMAASEQQINEWADAILNGGQAARQASQDAQSAASGWLNALTDFGQNNVDKSGGDSVFERMFGSDDDEKWKAAQQRAKDLYDQMTPLQQKQQDVTVATNELDDAIENYGAKSPQAVAAADALAAAQGRLEGKQRDMETATRSATQAVADQAAQSLAASNSELGYMQAIDNLQGSQEAYTAAIRDHGAASEEASDASLDLATSVLAAATAAGQMAADSLPATTSELERTTTANQGTLQELYRLRDTMGSEFPNAAANTIARLEAAGVTLDATGAAANGVAQDMSALGLSVEAVPNEKFVHVDAPTAEQKARLEGLGYTVTNLPDGDIYVSASPEDAEAAINYAARTRYTTIVATVVSNMLGGAKPYAETGSGGNPIGLPSVGGAIGGIVKPFADGGFEPMRGGIAQIVQPNTWRVIGDRVSDDEAYIPINGSARSRSILEQTASRMGYSGGSGGGSASVNIAGATITGTLEIGGDGLARIVDGRVVSAVTTIINRGAYNP